MIVQELINRGIKRGLEQGLEQGQKQYKIKTAQKILKENFSIEKISYLLDLEIEQVIELKKTMI